MHTKEEMTNDEMNSVVGDYTTIILKRLRDNLLRWKQKKNMQQSMGWWSIGAKKTSIKVPNMAGHGAESIRRTEAHRKDNIMQQST